MLKSKERVKRALTFNTPDRIPEFRSAFGDVFPLFNLPTKKWQPNEINVYPWYITPLIRKLKIHRWKKPSWAIKKWWEQDHEVIDEWGCYWNQRAHDLTMGHPGRPAITTWDEMETWEPSPTITDPKTYRLMNWMSKFSPHKYKICVVNSVIFIQNRVSMLRGFSNLLIDHRRNSRQVHALVKKVTDIFQQNIEMLMNYKPDGIWACDDLGTQQALFFSPDTFKKFYVTPYKQIINYIHDHDCSFHLHSCGNIAELIPTLIDIGVDSLEFDSPRLNPFEKLIKFKGKIPFWACVNIQSVYPNGSPKDVEQEVKDMIKTLSTDEGGYLAYFYPDTHVINVPKRNVKAFKRALKKWGKYPLNLLS
ncbi:MAG: uroporphyrinogen decarboxylase family protein [Candidatus Helarchaeota archaeon]